VSKSAAPGGEVIYQTLLAAIPQVVGQEVARLNRVVQQVHNAHAGVAGVIGQHHDIAGKPGVMRPTDVQQHAVVLLLNIGGAHNAWFTRNIVVLTDNAGNTGVGEAPGVCNNRAGLGSHD
jgi:hypothetical protein